MYAPDEVPRRVARAGRLVAGTLTRRGPPGSGERPHAAGGLPFSLEAMG